MQPAIVVGVDGSRASREALRWAANESLLTGLPLRVLHEWRISALAAAPTEATGYAQACAADARARATRWVLDALGDEAAQSRWTLELVEIVVRPTVAAPAAATALLP